MTFILGSSSQIRLDLLKRVNFVPDLIVPADINEIPLKKEKPELYVQRVALEKCNTILKTHQEGVILTADTIGTRNKQILRKTYTDEEVLNMLNFISGKNFDILTAFCIAKDGTIVTKKLVKTKIYLKHFNKNDIKELTKSKEGIGTCCACRFEGLMQGCVRKIVGSFSNIFGLPTYEVKNALISAGIKTK